jgi:hypothetical protein
MSELTREQIDFLQEQGIDLKYVFNADGFSKVEYRSLMKELNKLIAFNVSPCQSKGHTLRTRSGHCCQCNTAALGFQKRNDCEGIVYIAGTLTGKLMKIGFSKAVEVREESLNRTRYAGFLDWKILLALRSKDAGRIENKANSLLRPYAYSTDYKHDGHLQDSKETYFCAYSKAKEILQNAYQAEGFVVDIVRQVQTSDYEFRNLSRD